MHVHGNAARNGCQARCRKCQNRVLLKYAQSSSHNGSHPDDVASSLLEHHRNHHRPLDQAADGEGGRGSAAGGTVGDAHSGRPQAEGGLAMAVWTGRAPVKKDLVLCEYTGESERSSVFEARGVRFRISRNPLQQCAPREVGALKPCWLVRRNLT